MDHDDAVVQARSIARFAMRMDLDPGDVAPEVADLTGLDDAEAMQIVMAVMRSEQEREIEVAHDTMAYAAALEAAP